MGAHRVGSVQPQGNAWYRRCHRVAPIVAKQKAIPAMTEPPRQSDPLGLIRDDARRERLLDMHMRLRPYRIVCFVILALALALISAEAGWWLLALLGVGFAAFPVIDRLLRSSTHPCLWAGASWAVLPLVLTDVVIRTGGASSPVLMWFALPTVTLGARFSPRGIALGTAYVLVLLGLGTYGLDTADAAAHQQEVIAAVALVLSTVILSGALVESDRAHRHRATLDPLTGLYNRNALEQRLTELEGQPCNAGEGLSYALLLCDLDHFKRVNDQLGHAAGDAVLQDVAYTMRATLRAGDSIYRIGGEEILVVLPGTDEAAAAEIAERLRVAVRERRPVGVPVTVSIGLAITRPEAIDTDDLVARADTALYAAKAGGRDTVVVAP